MEEAVVGRVLPLLVERVSRLVAEEAVLEERRDGVQAEAVDAPARREGEEEGRVMDGGGASTLEETGARESSGEQRRGGAQGGPEADDGLELLEDRLVAPAEVRHLWEVLVEVPEGFGWMEGCG